MALGRARLQAVEKRGRAAARRASMSIALKYALAAALWVVLSDRVLGALALPTSAERFLASVKGVLFVLVTAALLYVFAVRRLHSLYSSELRYRQMFENATEGIILVRLCGNSGGIENLVIDDINHAQLMRLRVRRDDVVGARAGDDGALAEDLRPYFERVWRAAEYGETERFETHSPERDTYGLGVVYSVDDDLWAVAVTDITDVRRAERKLRSQDERIREAYIDVLDAVTGGKLVLLPEEELMRQLGEPISDVKRVSEPAELGEARHEVCEIVEPRFPQLADSIELPSVLGEALTNALKHGGGGWYRMYSKGDLVQIVVSDNGPGIDFRSLPKATLVAGYSTAGTLGVGFTIMLQLTERIILSTRPGRTVLVLELSASRIGAAAAEGAGF